MYKLWAFVRQSLIRIYLFFAKLVYKLSGGKRPKTCLLYTSDAADE